MQSVTTIGTNISWKLEWHKTVPHGYNHHTVQSWKADESILCYIWPHIIRKQEIRLIIWWLWALVDIVKKAILLPIKRWTNLWGRVAEGKDFGRCSDRIDHMFTSHMSINNHWEWLVVVELAHLTYRHIFKAGKVHSWSNKIRIYHHSRESFKLCCLPCEVRSWSSEYIPKVTMFYPCQRLQEMQKRRMVSGSKWPPSREEKKNYVKIVEKAVGVYRCH